MYIKRVRKRNPGGEKDYEYLHLVENVRTEYGPRQRLLLNLGALPIVPEDHKALANTIEGMLLGQTNLLSPDPSIERYARNALQKLLARDAQSEERADAHLFISVLAYHLLIAVEHRLRRRGDHRSWASVRDVLSTHQRLTIEYREKTNDGHQQHHLRVCSQPEAEHKFIYEHLGLDPEPLPRTRYVGK